MSAPGYRTVSFLSDYGRVDEFVGVVHSVIHALAPGTTVIDISHDVAPFDVRAGGLLLARCAQYLSPGVVLAVVDPGVGSARRAVAVEVGDGASVLVGPDNGLLAPAVALVGGASRAVELDRTEIHLPSPGATFAGRDVFAPVAAQLCNGVELLELGTEIDPALLVPAMVQIPSVDAERATSEVLWVDHFGNVQLNVDPVELDALGSRFEVGAHERGTPAVRVHDYTEVPPGGLGLLVDSYGLIAVSAQRASAAELLGVTAGDTVTLVPLGPGDPGAVDPTGNPAVAVSLGARRGGEPTDR